MITDLLAAYPGLTWRQRAHMAVRWRICPLEKIAALVPEAGFTVDLGCGHGLFSLLLALGSSARSVLGIDLDADKIALAQSLRQPNLRFIAGDITSLTDMPSAQSFTIIDVFYLVPFEEQERLLQLVVERLAPGGVIVLKDMAESPRWKARLNLLEETLAVRVLGITLGHDFYFRSRADWTALLEGLGLEVQQVPLDRGYYHPHIVYQARRP